MATRVLYYGEDECQRLLVLRNAGYSIDECSSIFKLRLAFDSSELARPSAVLMTDARAPVHHEAISFVRAHPPTPLILFQSCTYSRDEADFDLVIPGLTPPKEWLEKIAATIARTRALLADSAVIREQTVLLKKEVESIRQESESVRKQSAFLRQRSAQQRAALSNIAPPPEEPDPDRDN